MHPSPPLADPATHHSRRPLLGFSFPDCRHHARLATPTRSFCQSRQPSPNAPDFCTNVSGRPFFIPFRAPPLVFSPSPNPNARVHVPPPPKPTFPAAPIQSLSTPAICLHRQHRRRGSLFFALARVLSCPTYPTPAHRKHSIPIVSAFCGASRFLSPLHLSFATRKRLLTRTHKVWFHVASGLSCAPLRMAVMTTQQLESLGLEEKPVKTVPANNDDGRNGVPEVNGYVCTSRSAADATSARRKVSLHCDSSFPVLTRIQPCIARETRFSAEPYESRKLQNHKRQRVPDKPGRVWQTKWNRGRERRHIRGTEGRGRCARKGRYSCGHRDDRCPGKVTDSSTCGTADCREARIFSSRNPTACPRDPQRCRR